MRADDKPSPDIQDALNKGLLKRLPLTFLPFVNQQLSQWVFLFPNERQSVERLLRYVASLTSEQSAGLFRDVVQLEEKMGVRQWEFSTTEQSILNSSQLARSPYFQEWRRAVQAVFDAADRHESIAGKAPNRSRNRLVLLNVPRSLPLDRNQLWKRWQGTGRPVALDLGSAQQAHSVLDFLLNGMPQAAGVRGDGLLDEARKRGPGSPADTWVVDAGRSLIDSILAQNADGASTKDGVLLSYGRLDLYRQNFSHEMNTMRKDLADADAVFDRLRKVEVAPWCPPELASAAAVQEFLRSLYLTGNGAVIFGNSFVEWAASEAFRRARPAFLAAQFGVRSKPKPFTSVAVFDNPDQVNPLPAVDDLAGSAVDAQMLALYVWLAANRYEEYQRSTVCVCVAESISEAYIVAPPEFSLPKSIEPLSVDHLGQSLRDWIA
jgi:hypothetical protein